MGILCKKKIRGVKKWAYNSSDYADVSLFLFGSRSHAQVSVALI